MDDIEQSFAAYQNVFVALGTIGTFFLVAIVLETIWDLLARNRKNLWETAANFGIYAGNIALDYLGLGILFVVGLLVAEPFALFDVKMHGWHWPLALLIADFLYYWMHRWEHEIRILWAYHSVHHSSPEFNLTTSLRLSWIEGSVEWIFFVPMILLGFGTVETIISILIVIQYQTWIHTVKIGKLGLLDKIINTPSVHRVHHGSNTNYLDKNYGGILMLWDQVFGTYQAEDEPVVFGITEPLNSANPFVINFREFILVVKNAFAAKGIRKKFRAIFGRP